MEHAIEWIRRRIRAGLGVSQRAVDELFLNGSSARVEFEQFLSYASIEGIPMDAVVFYTIYGDTLAPIDDDDVKAFRGNKPSLERVLNTNPEESLEEAYSPSNHESESPRTEEAEDDHGDEVLSQVLEEEETVFSARQPNTMDIPSEQSSVQTDLIPPNIYSAFDSMRNQLRVHMWIHHVPPHVLELQSMYLIRNTPGPIDLSKSASEILKEMDAKLDIGCLVESSVTTLERIFSLVMIPLLDESDHRKVFLSNGIEHRAVDHLRGEFLSSLKKFALQLSHVKQQVSGEIRIQVPEFFIDNPQRIALEEPDLVERIQDVVRRWTEQVRELIDSEKSKDVGPNESPMRDIEFWRDRNATVGTVYESLNSKQALRILDVLQFKEQNDKVGDSEVFAAFSELKKELNNLYSEAKDNVKFLQTLERHFKNLIDGDLQTILDTIPSMLGALRMVWIISRYFNKDNRMRPLMERIADAITGRVSELVDITGIISQFMTGHYEDSVDTLRLAEEVLIKWESSYESVKRNMVEERQQARWDFSASRLFDRARYMAHRLEDVTMMLEDVQSFRKILGPKLKAVTGESHAIEKVLSQAEALLRPVREFPYNVFNVAHEREWTILVDTFRNDVLEIERITMTFIDDSFKDLRSAKGAFELQQNFKEFQTRSSIQQLMDGKYPEIFRRFSDEIDSVREIFVCNREHPPLSKNQPPVAGAIYWMRSLFHRVSKTWLRFQQSGDVLFETSAGAEIRDKFHFLAADLKSYENKIFHEWKQNVELVTVQNLKASILDRKNDDTYSVRFDPSLNLVMQEAKYLDRLGFTVPDAALNVALQEDKYHALVEGLKEMLDTYHSALNSVGLAERQVLLRNIRHLQDVLSPGLNSLNWNSLGIHAFIERCKREIIDFQHQASKLEKYTNMISGIISSIGNTNLFRVPEKEGSSMELHELDRDLDIYRDETTTLLVQKYQDISDILLSIEQLLFEGKAEGRNRELREYYSHWEKRIYRSLGKLVTNSLGLMYHHMRKSTKEKPIFRVTLELSPPDVLVEPTADDMVRVLKRIPDKIIESTRLFVRWQRGTCIPCSRGLMSKENPTEEEVASLTFWYDINFSPQVEKRRKSVRRSIDFAVASIEQLRSRWKKHFSNFWTLDRNTKADNYNMEIREKILDGRKLLGLSTDLEKDPPLVPLREFEDRFLEFEDFSADLFRKSRELAISFINVNCGPLISAIDGQVKAWTLAYGKHVKEAAVLLGTKINALIEQYADSLVRETSNVEDLEFVLNVLANIKERSMEIELKLTNISDAYDLLSAYNIPFDRDDFDFCSQLSGKWSLLISDAVELENRLAPIKESFTETTIAEVNRFIEEVRAFHDRFFCEGPGVGEIDLDQGLEKMKFYRQELATKSEMRDKISKSQRLFDLPITDYPELIEVASSMDNIGKVYDTYAEWKGTLEKWSRTLWSDINIDELSDGTKSFLASLTKNQALRSMKSHPLYKALEDTILSFQSSIPLFGSMKSEALRDRHWVLVMERTGVSFDASSTSFTLRNLVEMELFRYEDEINEIVAGAQREQNIEKGIKEIEDKWRFQRLEMFPFKDDRGYVLGSIDDILMVLEENMLNLGAYSSNPSAAVFVDQIRNWERRLSHIQEVLDVWILVQLKWTYLEGIFIGSDDIRNQLPQEAKRFDQIDKNWHRIMNETLKDTNVLSACHVDRRLDDLQTLHTELELCQKGLSDYLEKKRNAFPRFFFISDDELLSVLGSSDPQAVQEHMQKMFENCEQLNFQVGSSNILGMTSSESESYNFLQPVKADGAVEDWLTVVESEMRRTLHQVSKEAVFYYPSQSRIEWIIQYLGMVGLLGSQIWWTWEVEDAFNQVKEGEKTAVKQLASKLSRQLSDLVEQIRGQLSKRDRKKLNTMIIVDVHARDIVDRFVRDSILDAREFDWESQLRFYWDRDVDDCTIRQCTGEFRYGYEYMGLNGRLVITPLTDRCFMTLTQALTFNLGGSPAGPAGTGKTESVKDLAKAMGLMCYVFNCGEGLDYKAMGSIFSGLAQCGAWGCFDEFNRIELPVLSVVSNQIQKIQYALGRQMEYFQFEGHFIRLDPKMGIFITMNPGYAGRVELPDNLKALFRPCTMVVPDLEIICEIMLFSEGFQTARILARKMVTLYSLARGQLSKQHHYDWGLRALKAVLVMAGDLKRRSPTLDEETVLMRALRDMNAPKFVYEDVPLFLGLIDDLSPGLQVDRVTNEDLTRKIEKVLEEGKYQMLPKQVDKVFQLYETMTTRHTTMVVGPTGGGKSVVIQTLAKAQTALDFRTKMNIINPKAQTVLELYGVLDPATRDWTDGLLSNLFRHANNDKFENDRERRWIVFDGDVDAVWVENMNSVMDDNKLLTLPNGERIQLKSPQAALLFEVGDLQYASPATVSRCGMVYVDPKNLGYEPFIHRWLAGRRIPEQVDLLRQLFKQYCRPCVDFVREGKRPDGKIGKAPEVSIVTTGLNMVEQLCNLLGTLLKDDGEVVIKEPRVIESCFIFAVVWSIGINIVESDRVEFDSFLKDLCPFSRIDNGPNMDRHVGAGSIPENGTLYDYLFDFEETPRWTAWKCMDLTYVPPSDGRFASILVPTVDTFRSTWILSKTIESGRPCLFVGESGTAKSVIIHKFMNGLDGNSTAVLNINFSSRTTSMDVQNTIMENVDKRTKGVFGPKPGKTLMVFVDDLSMPIIDKYGTQQPIALLKLLLERGYMYDRSGDPSRVSIKDVQFISAMNPPGAGRNSVDPRFISLFSTFTITFPSSDSIDLIYNTILSHHLRPFASSIQETCAILPKMTLLLYNSIVEQLPPTPAKFHYVFNLRDLSRVFEGLCQATPDYFETTTSFIRLWRHECLRTFCDRLITDEDKIFVRGQLSKLVDSFFPDIKNGVMTEPLLFASYVDAIEHRGEPLLYREVGGYPLIRPVVEEFLEMYNAEHQEMNLVMFDDALEHLNRLVRVLSMDRGNALLVGVGGSGKQSLTRLATSMLEYELFEITLSRGYNESNFRDDLIQLYKKLGEQNRKVVFLFTDSHVVDEGFLELINNMLTSGMVPALFPDDEKNAITSNLRGEAMANGYIDVWSFFVDKCRNNLHIVLAMSPAGENLRRRCRNFPGLVNNTVIDWFQPWPEQALYAVGSKFLENVGLREEIRESIYDLAVLVHTSVSHASVEYETRLRRRNYVTPKHFLDFIENYKKLLRTNQETVVAMCNRLEGGLAKIEETAANIQVLQRELEVKKVDLEHATSVNKKLMIEISEKSIEVQEKQDVAAEKEAQLSEESKRISEFRSEAEAQLAEAEPVLLEASEALKNIKKGHIVELKAFKKPAVEVQEIMICVINLFGNPDFEESWGGATKMMANPNFVGLLQNFEKDKLSDKKIRKVRHVLDNKALNFDQENINKVSSAASGILVWVRAMLAYWEVFKMVQPKKEAVRKAEFEQMMNQRMLNELREQINELNRVKGELEAKFEKGDRERRELEETARIMERRVNAASALIAGLSSEKERWGLDLLKLKESREQLLGDCLLSAGFMSYLGPFTSDFRSHLLDEVWLKTLQERNIPHTSPFSVQKLLTSDVEISQWASQGLPSDDLSIQNGILTTRASRFPLCIDPQLQAVKWIKEREGKDLQVCTFNDAEFPNKLSIAIMMGTAFLFEGVDMEIDPLINPILEKAYTIRGGQKIIMLADKEVPWDDGFRLYLCTKIANPSYAPEVFGKTMIINYSVTEDGLEEQLLNEVVAFEEEKLEQQRTELIRQMSQNRTQLKKLEDMLLHLLNTSTGMILDNEELIHALEVTKEQATDIQHQLRDADETRVKIEVACNQYRPAAKRGRVIFFVMSALSNINSMYEYSLLSYLSDVYRVALRKREPSMSVDTKLENIIKLLTEIAYDYTCMGIFERHKDMFAFQLAIGILEADNNLNRAELNFFLKGNLSLTKSARKKPFDWLPDQGWEDLIQLQSVVEECARLADDVTANEAVWFDWFNLEQPDAAEYPMNYSQRLSLFQQLCLLRCFRVDRVNLAIRSFIVHTMGEKYITPPPISFSEIYRLSNSMSPIVCIISPGADPAGDIQDLAIKMDMINRLKRVSLGQGQGPVAKETVEHAVLKGQWVILENCHLLVKWLRTLERILEENEKKKVHQEYRLWITTEATPQFPIGILQRSLKVVQEPPNNLRLNMRNTFAKIDEDEMRSCHHILYRPLLYVLTFFHAVVQERRKYGKVGWNVTYDFNESDFSISRRLVKMYLDKAYIYNDPVPWESLRYLVGEVMYGGRVTDSFDRRVLTTYLKEYMGEFLFDEFQRFHFFHDDVLDYKLPDRCDRDILHRDVYAKSIDDLPFDNSPEVFGLHANAEIGYNTLCTRQIWIDLIELQPRSASGSGDVSRETFVMSVISDIEKKIPSPFPRHIIREEIGVPTPTQVVLLQELERWNNLVLRMSSSLIDLRRALIGEIGMSAELEELMNSIFNGQLPSMWLALAPATEKNLAGWLEHFERRYLQYDDWVKNGEPTVVWLSGLHIPESYLTALVQTTCRRYKWPLDRSTLYTKVTHYCTPDEVPERLLDGCFVQGLFLEGASWNFEMGCLDRQKPKVLVEELPIIQVIPIESSKLKLIETFRAPVYVTQARRSAGGVGLVFEADLNTNEHPSHWVLQGVALTLNIA